MIGFLRIVLFASALHENTRVSAAASWIPLSVASWRLGVEAFQAD
jgi:hypothetical protein